MLNLRTKEMTTNGYNYVMEWSLEFSQLRHAFVYMLGLNDNFEHVKFFLHHLRIYCHVIFIF